MQGKNGTIGLLLQFPLSDVTEKYRTEHRKRIQHARRIEDQVRMYLALVKIYKGTVAFMPTRCISQYLLVYSQTEYFQRDMRAYLKADYTLEDLLKIGNVEGLSEAELLGHTEFLFKCKFRTSLVLEVGEQVDSVDNLVSAVTTQLVAAAG